MNANATNCVVKNVSFSGPRSAHANLSLSATQPPPSSPAQNVSTTIDNQLLATSQNPSTTGSLSPAIPQSKYKTGSPLYAEVHELLGLGHMYNATPLSNCLILAAAATAILALARLTRTTKFLSRLRLWRAQLRAWAGSIVVMAMCWASLKAAQLVFRGVAWVADAPPHVVEEWFVFLVLGQWNFWVPWSVGVGFLLSVYFFGLAL
ncbi:hypothetical protein BDY21DRAFT_424106 [Lineolata rhizophorae]|uniref:Uncharacterized protein n=1 Tax=Lineolata rhizophorae TaxID=578093 RepID=A0A6A6NRA0_9PEZI|nr:hypothetical protein BDY21DRAFT_424106 [Lineolata rhizophorae]